MRACVCVKRTQLKKTNAAATMNTRRRKIDKREAEKNFHNFTGT